jgi:cyanoexosortase A
VIIVLDPQFRRFTAKPSFDYWLLATSGLGLIYLHLLLTWKFTNNSDQLLLNLIFWGTIVRLIWQKRTSLEIQSDWSSGIIGSLLMGLLLSKSISLFPAESEFIRLFPGFAGLALALVTTGWKLSLYRREFAIVVLLMLPPGLLGRIVELVVGSSIQKIIAQSAAFLMHYFGVNLIAQDSTIVFKTSAVKVEYACTGIPIWILLLQLSGLIMIGLGLKPTELIRMLIMATGLTWVLATIRVVVMASVMSQPASFEYWHGMAGGQIFSTIAIVLFALCCQRLPAIAKSLA